MRFVSDRKGVHRVIAASAAVAIAAAVFFLRRTGVLEGVPALFFAILLVLVLPWATNLSGRILVGGALFLGWMPLLWWVPLPVPQVDRVGLTLALVSGCLTCWVLWGSDVGARAKRLIPNVVMVDAMPFAAAGLAAWTTWPLIVASSGALPLNLLMKVGWDHASHAAMVLQIRAQGGIVPVLGTAPDGSQWAWASYPQHFHAADAALTELYSGPVVGDAAREVLMYGRSLALLMVLIAALLAAGVAQIPGLRRRPLLAWPVAAALVAAFVFGPGSHAMSLGQPNFVMACATAGLAVLVAAQMSGELKPLHILALGGLVVATVHGWTLLAPVAVVGAAVAFLPLGRERWPRTRGALGSIVAALVATLAASFAVVPLLRASGGMGILTLGEHTALDIHVASMSLVLLVGCTAAAVGLAALVRRQTSESAAKGLGLAATAAVGMLILAFVGAYEYLRVGTFGYYFDKLETGVTLTAFAVLAAGVGVYVGPAQQALGRGRKSVAVLAAVLAVVAALQVQGVEGFEYHYRAKRLTAQPTAEAQRLLDAAALAQTRPFGSTVYVAAMPKDPVAQLAEHWFSALSISYTLAEDQVANHFRYLMDPWDGMDLDEASRVTLALLAEDPKREVIVAPEVVTALRASLPERIRSRVITWGQP